ncbi:hypothetical protein FHG87_018113 [Trinorchestia longiramus]|nr:hypothetical protein FHG87_018113 [Trinorchestia longiramus]
MQKNCPVKIAGFWNRLPEHILSAGTGNTLKNHLDKHCKNYIFRSEQKFIQNSASSQAAFHDLTPLSPLVTLTPLPPLVTLTPLPPLVTLLLLPRSTLSRPMEA